MTWDGFTGLATYAGDLKPFWLSLVFGQWIHVGKGATARALLKSRRYLYVLFMCQQALEKLLKAHVTARTGEFPPRCLESQTPSPLAVG